MSTYYHEEWHRNQSILQSFTFSDRSLRYRNCSKITVLICEPYTHEPGLAETTLQSFHSLQAEFTNLPVRSKPVWTAISNVVVSVLTAWFRVDGRPIPVKIICTGHIRFQKYILGFKNIRIRVDRSPHVR